jgi:hypothetical protein
MEVPECLSLIVLNVISFKYSRSNLIDSMLKLVLILLFVICTIWKWQWCWCSRGTCCLQLHHTPTLKVEAACTSKTLAIMPAHTQCKYTRAGWTSGRNQCENLESVNIFQHIILRPWAHYRYQVQVTVLVFLWTTYQDSFRLVWSLV